MDVKKYLEEHKIETANKLVSHIVELKRNTKPNLELISSLASYLPIMHDNEILEDSFKKNRRENWKKLENWFCNTSDEERAKRYVYLDKKGAEQNQTAYKETEGKLFYELDWVFITQMAERMASNKKESKYALWNWKKTMTAKGIEDLKQATLRHLLEVLEGRYEDDGRPFGHIEAIADNMMMINYQIKQLNKS